MATKAELEKRIQEQEEEMSLLADRMFEAESRKTPEILYQTDPKLVKRSRELQQENRVLDKKNLELLKQVAELQHENQRLLDRIREMGRL